MLRRLPRLGSDLSPPGRGHGRGGRVQGTGQPCLRPDAGRGASPGVQAGGAAQGDAVEPRAASPAMGGEGGGRLMVTTRFSPEPRLRASSSRIVRKSRVPKQAVLPAAASAHSAPALSARDAKSRPAAKSAALMPRTFFPPRLSLVSATPKMLAPRSDNGSRRHADRPAAAPGRCRA